MQVVVVVNGRILATSTSLRNANDISTANMCLHLTPRNLWSGHEQTQPKSVEQTSYSPLPFCDFTTYFNSLILFIAPLMLAIANHSRCRFIAVLLIPIYHSRVTKVCQKWLIVEVLEFHSCRPKIVDIFYNWWTNAEVKNND